jgi:iron complex outermembrane recepter protein
MKLYPKASLLCLGLGVFIPLQWSTGQDITAGLPGSGDEVIELPPFEVQGRADEGFASSTALGGTRTREQLKDIPLSIQVINTEMIEAFAAPDVSRAVELVDGVEWDGVFINAYRYRGFFSGGKQVDFFNWAPPTNSYNLERVESISGPMSLLYGSIDPGGVLNEITKNPVFGESIDNLRVEYGSYDWFRVLADHNMPIGSRAGLRINAFYQSTDDFRDWKNREWYAVAPSFRTRIGRKFLLTLKGEAGSFIDNFQNNAMTYRINAIQDFMAFPIEHYVDGPVLDGLKGFYEKYGTPEITDRSYAAWGGPDVRNEVDYHTLTTSLLWEPAAGTAIDFVYNFQNYNRDYFGAAQVDQIKIDLNGYFVNRLWEKEYQDISSHNFRIIGSRDFNWGWTQQRLTSMLAWEYGDMGKVRLWAYGEDGKLVYDKLYLADGNGSEQTRAPEGELQNLWEYRPLYGNPTFDSRTELGVAYLVATGRYANGKLRSLVGLRYDTLSQTVKRSRANTGYAEPSTLRTDEWSPTIGLIWSALSWADLYANYSESFRQQDASRIFDSNGNLLDPVIGKGVETGIRMSFLDEKLTASVAVFQIDLENRPESLGQIPDPDFPDSFITGWAGADSRSEGIEFKLQGNPTRAITLTGGFSWKDVYNLTSLNEDLVDRKIRGYKNFTGTFSARYRVQDGPLKGLNVGANIQVDGDGLAYYDTATGLPVRIEGWQTVSLFAYHTFKLGDTFLTLQVNVRNLFDEEYIVTSEFTRPGDRRSVTVSANLRF